MFLAVVLLCQPAQAETVYDFTMRCNEMSLRGCLDDIEAHLVQLEGKEQGNAFCIPRAWGRPEFLSGGFPISLLEYLRVGLSASRFGHAQEPVEDAMRDILAELYPCD